MRPKFHFTLCRVVLAALLLGLAVAPRLSAATVLATFNFGVKEMVYDAARGRVYATVPTTNELAVIDAKTLTLIQKIYIGSNPQGLCLNSDNSMLFIANHGATLNGIQGVDLESLAITVHINTDSPVSSIFCGFNHKIYALSDAGIRIYNDVTKLKESNFSLSTYSGILRGDLDLNYLYYANFGLSGSTFSRINLASNPPQILQSASGGSNGQDLAISHNSQYLIYPNGAPYDIKLFSTGDITQYYGTFNTGPYPRLGEFSWNDDYVFAVNDYAAIGVYKVSDFTKVRSITVPNSYDNEITDLLTESSNSLLFAGSENDLRVYDSTLATAPLKITDYSLDFTAGSTQVSFSTLPARNYRVQGCDQLGGTWTTLGAIISGTGDTVTVSRTFGTGKTKYFIRVIKT